MAYADQPMSRGKLTSIIIVVVLHALLGYAFITGLAYNVIKSVPTVLETFDVDEPKPPEEKPPPPPPEKELPPPPQAPPPVVAVQSVAPAPQIVTQPNIPTPPAPVITPPAPAAPQVAQPFKLRGDRRSLITNDDYPPVAQRAGEEGATGAAWDVTADGRVENCRVTSSSGSSTLDATTCQLITRRFRYKPAVDANGQPMRASDSQRIVWKIPKD
jgi:protein TonB